LKQKERYVRTVRGYRLNVNIRVERACFNSPQRGDVSRTKT
jgi:hypothetical protein